MGLRSMSSEATSISVSVISSSLTSITLWVWSVPRVPTIFPMSDLIVFLSWSWTLSLCYCISIIKFFGVLDFVLYLELTGTCLCLFLRRLSCALRNPRLSGTFDLGPTIRTSSSWLNTSEHYISRTFMVSSELIDGSKSFKLDSAYLSLLKMSFFLCELLKFISGDLILESTSILFFSSAAQHSLYWNILPT